MKKTLIIAVSILLGIILAGCQNPFEKAAEKVVEKSVIKAVEKAVEKELDENGIDIDIKDDTLTVTSDEGEFTIGGGTWPEDTPDIIPEFKDGDISSVMDNGMGASLVYFTNLKDNAAKEYIKLLDEAGWEQKMNQSYGEGFLYQGLKDDIALTVSYTNDVFFISWMNDTSS